MPQPNIILVEDHGDTLGALTYLLKSMGCRVAGASSVADAIKLSEQQTFDLYIGDLNLPDGTGTDVLRHLQAHGQIKSIAITGDPKPIEPDFDCHLRKPIQIEALEEAIHQLLP